MSVATEPTIGLVVPALGGDPFYLPGTIELERSVSRGDALRGQPLGAGQDLAPVGAATQGVGVGMLQEDQPLIGPTLSELLA